MDKFITRKRKYPVTIDNDAETERKPKINGSASDCLTGKDISGSAKSISLSSCSPNWRKIRAENLDLDYCILLSSKESRDLIRKCEDQLEYNTGRIAQVQIFGKWIDIPRKQVAFGDAGLSYTFSGNTIPARPWIPFLSDIRDRLTALTGHNFNFVLINRYKDGKEYMGEHKDDEKDLDENAPIASLSLGHARDFYFKHQDCRGKKAMKNTPKSSPKTTQKNKRSNQNGQNSGYNSSTDSTKVDQSSSHATKEDQSASRPENKSDCQLKFNESPTLSRNIDKVNLVLEPGSLLMMNPPTNKYWYHALPKRMRVSGTRINLTFRCMKLK